MVRRVQILSLHLLLMGSLGMLQLGIWRLPTFDSGSIEYFVLEAIVRRPSLDGYRTSNQDATAQAVCVS